MTGIINWFKTIFILEITGEIALKLVPPKYKEFIAFVMKLILVMAIIIPLLNIKNADISEITDGISNGFKTDAYLERLSNLIDMGFENTYPIIDNFKEIETLSNISTKKFKVGIRIAAEEEPKFEFYTSR